MAVLETVRKAISEGDVDFLREGVRVLAQAVMEAEATELTVAPKGERDPERRLTHRNGYRERRWDTRVGALDLAIPNRPFAEMRGVLRLTVAGPRDASREDDHLALTPGQQWE